MEGPIAFKNESHVHGDEETLWDELLNHPAEFMNDPWANFEGSAGITRAEAICVNLDDV